MQLLVWLARAFVFFTLFAFALNNQQTAVVHWFFGVEWRTPMVIVVLTAVPAPPPPSVAPSEFGPEHPPREGF